MIRKHQRIFTTLFQDPLLESFQRFRQRVQRNRDRKALETRLLRVTCLSSWNPQE
jgi:hypothetical protein